MKPAPMERPRLRLVPRASTPADALTFDNVFHTYGPYVAAIGAKILGRDEELEDLMQDVFLEAHRGLKKVREPLAIKGWLAKVTVRTARRRLQLRKLRRLLWMDAPTVFEAIVDPTASPEERAQVASLYRRLEEIPTDARIAWILRHVEGASMDEVADLCACSISTARRRILEAQGMLAAWGIIK